MPTARSEPLSVAERLAILQALSKDLRTSLDLLDLDIAMQASMPEAVSEEELRKLLALLITGWVSIGVQSAMKLNIKREMLLRQILSGGF